MSDRAERLERELRALLPVLLINAARDGIDPARVADRAVRLVMRCARPLLDQQQS